jgi:dienelactone hydrolase
MFCCRVVSAAIGIGILIAGVASGQETTSPPFYYPAPPAGSVVVSRDIAFGTPDTATLRMDVYRSARATASAPALVFFSQRGNLQQEAPWFVTRWAEVAAANDLVAIVPDLRFTTAPADFRLLLAHLTQHGDRYGINTDAIAVYAASGNAFAALPVLQDPSTTAVRAALIYYGIAPITSFRLDLPMLVVRAGLDRPALNVELDAFMTRAATQNAPVSFVNVSSGYHGFEIRNDDPMTRDVMDESIRFVKRTTSATFQETLRAGLTEATAAGRVTMGRHAEAVPLYARLVEQRPDDHTLRLSYGEALIGAREFARACDEFEKLRGVAGIGPRDRGLPAARACLGKGDHAAAVAWLATIPRQFLPPSIETDTAFAALRDRPDFRALFRR